MNSLRVWWWTRVGVEICIFIPLSDTGMAQLACFPNGFFNDLPAHKFLCPTQTMVTYDSGRQDPEATGWM